VHCGLIYYSFAVSLNKSTNFQNVCFINLNSLQKHFVRYAFEEDAVRERTEHNLKNLFLKKNHLKMYHVHEDLPLWIMKKYYIIYLYMLIKIIQECQGLFQMFKVNDEIIRLYFVYNLRENLKVKQMSPAYFIR